MVELRDRVRAVLETHWRADGYTVPNAAVYPWQWAWDSCFHAVIWAELGEGDRAIAELASLVSAQAPDGFLPHMRYPGAPHHHAELWGRPGTSSITQPPVLGHAIAELARCGIDVADELAGAARANVAFLLARPRIDGLVATTHPWETGCDDSLRWDHWLPLMAGGRTPDPHARRVRKGELVARIERSVNGSPLVNPAFRAGSVVLSALVVADARALGMGDQVAALAEAVASRWDPERRTWVDSGDAAVTSGRARTVEALLGLICDPAHAPAALADLVDRAAFGAGCGPRGAHRDEPGYDPTAYWRGPAWPQLTYLLWHHGAPLGAELVAGAMRSGLAEYWHPDTGEGLGAIPQSWAGLAVVAEAGAVSGSGDSEPR